MQANTNSKANHKGKDIGTQDHQIKICSCCGYDAHEPKASSCFLCGEVLHTIEPNDENSSLKFSTERIAKQKIKTANKSNLFARFKLKSQAYTIPRELKKPINLFGLLVIGLIMSLWINRFLSLQQKPDLAQTPQNPPQSRIVTEPSPKAVKSSSLQGLFSYGGAPFYASLISSGLNNYIESSYSGFELRFAKPLNEDYTSSNGIKMLLDDELSFAFSGRSLNDPEYKKAQLRGVKLKQVPFAIDGIVFFGNNNKSVSKLNLEQVRGIFQGEITNWNQINQQGQDLPIVPILLNNENLKEIGIDSSETADFQYVPNYTQALRKVIATPGAISFASASLVQGQQLIDVFALADSNLSNYTPAFVEGKPNLLAFKTGEYPLTRRLFLAYREDESPDQKAAEVYSNFLLSEEGQRIVEKSGFVPLK